MPASWHIERIRFCVMCLEIGIWMNDNSAYARWMSWVRTFFCILPKNLVGSPTIGGIDFHSVTITLWLTDLMAGVADNGLFSIFSYVQGGMVNINSMFFCLLEHAGLKSSIKLFTKVSIGAKGLNHLRESEWEDSHGEELYFWPSCSSLEGFYNIITEFGLPGGSTYP